MKWPSFIKSTDETPVLKQNLSLHAGDALEVKLHFNTTEKCEVREQMISIARIQLENILSHVFEPGLGAPKIDIVDLYSSHLLKSIYRLERENAKLKIKSSILRLLGFRKEVSDDE